MCPPQAQKEAANSVHAALGEALLRLGLPVDHREFRPHLTLARKYPGSLPASALPSVRWSVEGYALVESRTTPVNEYRIVHHFA